MRCAGLLLRSGQARWSVDLRQAGLALQAHGRQRIEGQHTAGIVGRGEVTADIARAGSGHQAGGAIHRVPHHGVLATVGTAHRASEHRASGHTDRQR